MSQKIVFVLDPETGWNRWDVNVSPLDFDETVVAQISSGVVRRLKNVIPVSLLDDSSRGSISIAMGNENANAVFSVPIYPLPLTAAYAPPSDGVLHPDFMATGPIFPMVWEVPGSMKLVLAISISKTHEVTQYLVAFNNGATFRLPLSHLYADCRLCPGRHATGASEVIPKMEAVNAAWTQFQKSQWNHDLFGDASAARVTGSRRMFGFKPFSEGFSQVPVPDDWPKYCEKVGNGFLNDYVIKHD